MQAQINNESLIKANAQFWEQMLGMYLEPIPESKEFCAVDGYLASCVGLSGMWTGRIEVRLADGLARTATAAMLMQPLETVNLTDTLDAIREITNMIAGGIKSSLPRPCSMTVPESAVVSGNLPASPCNENSLSVAFHHSSGEMMVHVLEQACALPDTLSR